MDTSSESQEVEITAALGGGLDSDAAVEAAVNLGMPARSLALYARWWQLETWLRDLTYVELRALVGRSWIDAVKAGSGRQSADAVYTHMAGVDNVNPLAYLDYSQLVQLIQAHWGQVGYALLDEAVWAGRQTELTRIRHRIGHMRRGHADDLGRLEQTLRDLEIGAFRAFASYNRRQVPDTAVITDPVTVGWIQEEHPDAQRLVGHASRQYDTRLRVALSRRPWVRQPPGGQPGPGYFWHADFYMRDRSVDLRTLWNDSSLDGLRHLLVHLNGDSPWHVSFTFSAADDAEEVADAIGAAFDAVLLVSRAGTVPDDYWERWRRRAKNVDHRVLTETGWQIVDETTLPISLFGAGGGVESLPRW